MEPIQLVIAAVAGAVIGMSYGVVGLLTKREPNESVHIRKLCRTAAIFAAAGVVVAVGNGGDVTREAVRSAIPQVSVVGIIVDMVWARLVRSGVIPRGETLAQALRQG